jgi:hypothetical protein
LHRLLRSENLLTHHRCKVVISPFISLFFSSIFFLCSFAELRFTNLSRVGFFLFCHTPRFFFLCLPLWCVRLLGERSGLLKSLVCCFMSAARNQARGPLSFRITRCFLFHISQALARIFDRYPVPIDPQSAFPDSIASFAEDVCTESVLRKLLSGMILLLFFFSQ